ncbi:MAG: pilus assembly protein TadG-related protein [bacterium]
MDDSGALIIFGLMLFVLMMMMGGIAVDVMRYESRRTSLQNTLDRSTLAAAALNQSLDPRTVVDDYFLKAGLADFLTSVTVTQGLNFREVKATALADTNPMFLHMLGIEQFNAPGASTAEQRVNNVEVMLVLDVSGSMASDNKLTNLQTAAKAFVSTVLGNDPDHKISIGLVPFNGQVNLGSTLASEFNTVYPSGATDVNCVDLPDSAYDSTTISQYAYATSVAPLSLSMTADADTYSSYSGGSSPNDANKWCPPKPTNIVRLPSQSISDLQGYLGHLTAVGATSINAGMKWGLGLLDPSSRGIYTHLISTGALDSNLAGRPFEYDDKEAMKVIVLMTDGEHFAEERVNDPYKSGLSPIWKGNDGNYSIYHSTVSGSNKYYVQHKGTWQSTPWKNSNNNGAAAVQQTWPQVWDAMKLSYVAYYYYGVPLGGSSSSSRNSIYKSMMNDMKSLSRTSDMDDQLQSVCSQAKAQNVIVYGIAFQAPTNGQTQIRNCSTDGENGSHYFNAQGLQISTAFAAIANNISQLRLTQ